MNCVSCGAELIPDARFCTRCGTRIELGSLLGVGTDLPPVPAPSAPVRQPRARPSESTPPQTPSRPPQHARPVDDDHHGSGGTFTPGRIAAMVATFVVLTLLGTVTLSQLFGSDAPEPPVASSSTEPGQGSTTPSPQTSAASATPEPSTPEPSTSPTPTTVLPEGARRCSKSGNDPVATAYSGNRDTSCAFTNAVRKAYREVDAANNPAPFRTYSTVTKRWYDVTCDSASPVRCQSANGAAVVFLGP